ANPVIVVVRVEEGADTGETTANIIGTVDDQGRKTGLQALLSAENKTGVRPRIIGAPGFDAEDITAAVGSIAEKLRAFGYAKAVGDTVSEAIAYRDSFGQRELMLIYGDFTAFDVDEEATREAKTVARAMGLRAYIDETVGWHKSLSNVPVEGVTGIEPDISFSLQQTGTDADLLNGADVTTLIRHSGFRFWGNRTCSEDANFAFETYVRTAQVLADSIAEAQFAVVDSPLLPGQIRSIIDSVNRKGRSLVRRGYLLGFEAWYNPAANSVNDLKSGKVYIDYDYTPVPPLENLNFNQRITDRYLLDFAERVAAA